MQDLKDAMLTWSVPTGIGFVLLLFVASATAGAAGRVDELMQKTLALPANALRGGQIYAQACASCHGATALGRSGAAIPSLAGQRASYLLLQIIDFAELDREAPEMHRVAALLGANPEQRWRDIAAYLASLTANQQPQTGDGRSLDIGSGIYRDDCEQCHGKDGEGDDTILSPALAGQHYSYLLLQLRSMAKNHRFANVDAELAVVLDRLSAADMAAVSDYISRLSQLPRTAANALP